MGFQYQDHDPDVEVLSEAEGKHEIETMSPQERCHLLRKFDIMWLAPFCHVDPGNRFRMG